MDVRESDERRVVAAGRYHRIGQGRLLDGAEEQRGEDRDGDRRRRQNGEDHERRRPRTNAAGPEWAGSLGHTAPIRFVASVHLPCRHYLLAEAPLLPRRRRPSPARLLPRLLPSPARLLPWQKSKGILRCDRTPGGATGRPARIPFDFGRGRTESPGVLAQPEV
ncbi:hypothetical protein GCM10025867_01270 [Frondihabitans sucicola]|uniref:Uncharacterized protein n=1 Tax=Frondihabitans sucicola TaxID=1268041 RepID=A0ABM8GHP5_9MICO|nr:hypothetical protein GCM10025867_01270 [Frondihabitans sucicola]